jgi:DNA-binding transcriptional regulator YiaG
MYCGTVALRNLGYSTTFHKASIKEDMVMASPERELQQGHRRIELMNFRKRHYLNCKELARLVGVHPSQVTRWENGMQTVPQWLENFLSCLDKQLLARRSATSQDELEQKP